MLFGIYETIISSPFEVPLAYNFRSVKKYWHEVMIVLDTRLSALPQHNYIIEDIIGTDQKTEDHSLVSPVLP